MKSYPYIGKGSLSGVVFLFFREGEALILDGGEGAYSGHEKGITETLCRNITHEYLSNTYGEVASPEHAEFIVELCLENSISFAADNARRKYFSINSGKLYFFCAEIDASNIGSKQITIPLPPKQIQTATPEEEFEMTKIMKNAGDNLVLGCEQDFKVARAIIDELREEDNCSDELLASRDEWPKIGDEFIHKGEMVTCISKGFMSDGGEVITFEFADRMSHGSCWNNGAWIKKPKTPEEELRDDIADIIDNASCSEQAAEYIVKEYLTSTSINPQ